MSRFPWASCDLVTPVQEPVLPAYPLLELWLLPLGLYTPLFGEIL